MAVAPTASSESEEEDDVLSGFLYFCCFEFQYPIHPRCLIQSLSGSVEHPLNVEGPGETSTRNGLKGQSYLRQRKRITQYQVPIRATQFEVSYLHLPGFEIFHLGSGPIGRG